MTPLIAYRSLIDHVATVELTNPPDNFFSVTMLEALATTLEALDDDDDCRAVLFQCARQARERATRGLAARTGVDHTVSVR